MIVTFSRRIRLWVALGAVILASVGIFHFRVQQEAQALKAMSWVVAGRVFIVDPGHGGEDPGKVSPGGVLEKDINLAVAKKLAVVLSQGGGQVILTRENDTALSGNEDTVRERKRADLVKRVELAETSRADLYLALHCNSFPATKWYGAQTFYSPAVAGSKELATFVQEELIKLLGNTTRKPKTDTTSIIFKRAKMPIVNVEMGFLSNPREEQLLQDPAYQDKIVWAIYTGTVRFLLEHGDQYRPALIRVDK